MAPEILKAWLMHGRRFKETRMEQKNAERLKNECAEIREGGQDAVIKLEDVEYDDVWVEVNARNTRYPFNS